MALLLPLVASAALPTEWTANALAARPDAAARAIERERGKGGFRAMDPMAAVLSEHSGSAGLHSPRNSLAVQASPDSTYLHWRRLCDALATRSPGSTGKEVLGLLGVAVTDPWLQLTMLAVGAVALCLAAWLAAGVVTLYHVVARGRLLLHDYSDSFPARFRRVTPVAFGVFVLSVLWTAGVGPLVVLVLVGVVLTPYMNLRARLVFGLAVFLGCLLPTAAEKLISWAGPGADTAWSTYRVYRGDAGGDLLAEIQAYPGGETARGRYLAARVTRRNGDLSAAEHLLGLAEKGLPPGLAENEGGNLAFLRGDLSAAERSYRAAIAARPGDPVPWLNQHLIHLKRLELDAADAALARARQLGEMLTDRFEEVRSADPEALYPVAHRIPHGWVAAAFSTDRSALPAWTTALRHSLFLSGGVIRPEYIGLFALFVALLAGRAGRELRSRLCPSCGFVMCPRCSRRVKDSSLCSACWSVANDREVDTSERERRERTAAHWAGLQIGGKRLAHLVLPGWGDYLGTTPVWGGMVALLWTCGFGFAVAAALFPLPLFAWGGLRFHWAAGLLPMGLAHSIGVWRALAFGKGE